MEADVIGNVNGEVMRPWRLIIAGNEISRRQNVFTEKISHDMAGRVSGYEYRVAMKLPI